MPAAASDRPVGVQVFFFDRMVASASTALADKAEMHPPVPSLARARQSLVLGVMYIDGCQIGVQSVRCASA